MPARHQHGGDRCRALVRDRINAKLLQGKGDDRATREAVREAHRLGCNVGAPRPYRTRPAMPGRRDDGWFNQ